MIDDLTELIARARAWDPEAGIALAALVEAQLLPTPPHAARRQRGGDPKAECRSARNEAVRALGSLLSADLSLEQQARAIARKVGRVAVLSLRSPRARPRPVRRVIRLRPRR
jgi:hypothetical protein